MGPDAALAACRFLHDASAMLLWGASAYLWALVPSNLAKDVRRRLRPLGVVTIAVTVATTAASLPIETAGNVQVRLGAVLADADAVGRVGLAVELVSLRWAHPTAFIVFAAGTGTCVGAGVLLFLTTLFATGPRR